MVKFILKRTAFAIITIICIATITFALMKALPGDPFHNPKLKPELRQALLQKYGLDLPISQQYIKYMSNLAHGDLGLSYKYVNRPVSQVIKESFPKSFALGWRAMTYSAFFGILFGVIAALKHQKAPDYIIIFISIVGVSVPSIVMGPLLAYYFGVTLGWLPVTVTDSQLSMILPSFTLGLGTLAFVARLMRSTTLEVLGQDYIQTAKSKGLSTSKIVWSHVIRNAIMPVVSVLGPAFAGIITGSIVIENVFAVAGLGGYFVTTITNQDYSMTMGITLFYAVLIIVSLLVVDIAYGLIDPRLKISSKGGE
ncbi:MAG TPA: ABC transporter permease [Clostridium sp.]|uniref:ABC transporter permease n=1 Tax=Clostridium sp. TaxID=1506 RepID=UPI002F93A0D3